MTELALQPALELVRGPAEHQIADYLTSLLGEARPRRVARMSEPGELKEEIQRDQIGKAIRDEHGKVIKTGEWVPRGKYEDVYYPLTRQKLLDHALGAVTYAVTLDQQGKARAGVIEIDQGGRSAIDAALRGAHQLGLVAFAFELLSPEDIHSGGHIWIVYDGWYPVADIIAQLDKVLNLAGLPANTELWPRDKAHNRGSDQGIRAPFGKHRTKATRGALRLQTGEITLLDTELIDGVYQVLSLPTNSAPPALQEIVTLKKERQTADKGASVNQFTEVQKPSHKVLNLRGRHTGQSKFTEAEQAAYRAALKEARPYIIAHYDLVETALDMGSERTRDGITCPCGADHGAGTKITIAPGGKAGYNHSANTGCKLPTKAGIDVTNLLMLKYQCNFDRLARMLAPHLFPDPKPVERPEPADTQYRAKAQDAQRKRAARLAARQERIARIDPLIDQLDQDDAIYPFARDLFAYHLACWSRGPEHYASIERITRDVLNLDRAPTGNETRRVQLAHQRLIECHYLKRTVRGSSATKETNCWQPGTMDGYRVIRGAECETAQQEAKNEGRITLRESSKDLLLESLDLVSGGAVPPHENVYADTLDDWQWSADEHSADELTILDLAEVETAPAQPEAPFVFDRSDLDLDRYSVDCGCYDATGRVVWRLWDDRTDQILGEYATEAEACAAAGAPVEGAMVQEVVDRGQWLVVDYRNYALISEHTSPTPAFAEAETLNVWAAALDHNPPAPIEQPTDQAETILDMDEIDRMVAAIQAATDELQGRHVPDPKWTRHEALVWRESHPVAPQSQAVYQQHAANREAERARIRAKWDAIGDNPSELGRRLGTLRGRLRKYPQSRPALEWQIHELHDRLAALTPVSEAVEPRGSQAPARRPAPVTDYQVALFN